MTKRWLVCVWFALCSIRSRYVDAQFESFVEPTRPVDLWNPFGTPTTPRQPGQLRMDEAVVRLSIGDVVGKKVVVENVPWTPNRDPLEEIRSDWARPEPNPVGPSNNVTVFTFLGVPYAEPPVSQRRFKPPQYISELPGEKPYLALRYAASCAQDIEARPNILVNEPYPFRVSEDCLYLNIFTPDASKVSQLIYPVLVFFHGGNYQTGSANEWPGEVLASRGIVVVTVNYRLGAFGFMSLGDELTGNYGLQDQRLALQFVRDHISSFGGDPQAVTVVGHDAGAVSVGLHMLSPLSTGLFRAASAMSGAEVSYHSTIGKPVLAFNNTIKLGRYLGCTQLIAEDVWNCIMTRSTNDIIRAVQTIPVEYNRYLFLPTVDGKQIPANPYWMLSVIPVGTMNYASPVPYLTGLNRQDGVEVVLEDRLLGEFNDFLLVDQQFMENFVLEYAFRHNYTMNREAIAEAIIDRYTYWPDPSDEDAIRDKFVELTTDAYYVAPVSLSAHLHSAAGSRVFMYVNNYEFGLGTDKRFLPSWVGVCHDCDLYLLFGFPFMCSELLPPYLASVQWTEFDRNASQLFTSVYRQFLRNMNPNFPFDTSWAPLQPRAHWYIDFNYSHWSEMAIPGRLKRDYRWEPVAFWTQYIPALVQYMTTTFSPLEGSMRRQVLAYQIGMGVLACILMGVTVLACLFAYLVFERNPRKAAKLEHDRRRLIRNTSGKAEPSSSKADILKVSSL
ncbi:Neuroligin-4, Y-linked [Toxocara canis]|uniref:Neuroligin-4, Y-linked n=1 Tax=Toxocara canis TaxID=6265 RepID=A0A0B2VHA5_TOXCA|nr:Neuroligin-4, Y-linked [Toxocara canis]